MSWHVEASLIHRYADGSLDPANAASVEAHLLACAACRTVAAAGTDDQRLEAIWTGVIDAIDRPRLRPLERILRALGIAPHVARLVAATPSLQTSWFAANAVVLAFAVGGGHIGPRGVLAFLSLAPLVPLAGIAAVYGPSVDPSHEVAVAAPLRGFRLLLLRTGTVLVSSILMLGVASIWVPAGWRSIAWLLPAVGLSAVALTLGTWVDPLRAAAGAAVGWVAVVGVAARAGIRGSGPILERLVVFNAEGQVAFAIVAAVGLVGLAFRSRAREVPGT